MLIALANSGCNVRRHELVTILAPNNRNFSTNQPLTHRVVGGNRAYFVPVDEVVALIGLSPRQTVLFGQLRDLGAARFPFGSLTVLAAQLLVARRFGRLRLLRTQLPRGCAGTLLLRQLLPLPLLLAQVSLGFFGLLFIGQTSLQQLIAQRHAHGKSPGTRMQMR